MIKEQARLPTIDKFFLEQRLEESRAIVREVIKLSSKPLVVQFSGGKDSMAMVGLVKEVTDNFVCSFMMTGIDFPEAVAFAKSSASELGVSLLISTPADHLGGLFERLAKFRRWPMVQTTWCSRDLKIRPQQKMLIRELGKGRLYKLVGVRRYESARRRGIYEYGGFIRPDNQVGGASNVYPILHWTDADVFNYLSTKGLPTSGLYKKYGVSGCYWCPFYQAEIYLRILSDNPNLYDGFIEWEEELGPSVVGNIYLRDLKEQLQRSEAER